VEVVVVVNLQRWWLVKEKEVVVCGGMRGKKQGSE
jgi:hypothetical protein